MMGMADGDDGGLCRQQRRRRRLPTAWKHEWIESMGVHGDGDELRFHEVWLDLGGGAVVEGGKGGCGG